MINASKEWGNGVVSVPFFTCLFYLTFVTQDTEFPQIVFHRAHII